MFRRLCFLVTKFWRDRNGKDVFIPVCHSAHCVSEIKQLIKLDVEGLHNKKQSSPTTQRSIAPTHSWPRHQMGVSGQRHAPAALRPGERTPGTHCTGGGVGLRAGLDTDVRGKILCPCRGSNPDHPVVQSVVRHYTDWATPASLHNKNFIIYTFYLIKSRRVGCAEFKQCMREITMRDHFVTQDLLISTAE
jgi:hypothetical protein